MKEVTYSSRSHRVMEIIAVSIIVLPFLAVLFYSDWLRMAIPTFHDGDEQIYHFPIIKSFSEQLPFPDISDYNSATGPLYHIVLAAGVRLLGLEIHSLRLLNMLFSIIGCIVFYKILRLRSDNHLLSALVSIVFSLSPYFFGSSFRLLTDNFAIMLYFASVYFLLKFSEKPNYGYWFSFCIFAMLCTVTRQVYVHIFLIGLFVSVFNPSINTKAKLVMTIGTFLSAIPLMMLIVLWEGFTPPTFQDKYATSIVFLPRSAGFAVAVVGVYYLLLHMPNLSEVWRNYRLLIPCIIIAILWLPFSPLAPQANRADDGYLWKLSEATPTILGSRLAFWMLFPIGLFALVKSMGYRLSGVPVGVWIILSLAPYAFQENIFQKYYDLSVLPIMLIWFAFAGYYKANKVFFINMFLLILLFCMYFCAKVLGIA